MSDDENNNVNDQHDNADRIDNFVNASGFHETGMTVPSLSLSTAPPPPPPPRKSTNYDELPTYDFNTNNVQPISTTQVSFDSEIHKVLTDSLNKTETDDEVAPEENKNEYREDFYTDITKMIRDKQEDNFGVLLPLRSNLFESYLASILMIFANIPKFSNLILKHEFLTFPYKPNWWNREKCSENSSLVIEIQRLVAFLHGDSDRAFSSLYNLINAVSRLIKEDYDEFDDYYQFIIQQIVNQFATAEHSIKEELESMFELVVSLENTSLYSVLVANGNLSLDLYETLFKVLGNSSFENIYLTKIPDVLSFVFEAGMDNLNRGFSVDELFYPQIFSEEQKDIVLRIEEEISSIKERKREIQQKINKLRVFSGKSVLRLLNQSKQYLHNEAEEKQDLNDSLDATESFMKDKYVAASVEMENISMHISETIKNLTEEERMLNEKVLFLENSKHNIDHILDDEKKSLFEPWILTGIVFNSSQFYYLNRQKEWIGVSIDEELCKSYSKEKFAFENVQRVVRDYTEYEMADGMMLIYVKQSVFMLGDYNPLNDTLNQFIEQDNKKLKDQYEILMQNVDAGQKLQ